MRRCCSEFLGKLSSRCWLTGGAMLAMPGAAWAARDLPYSVRGVQESFEKTSYTGVIIVSACTLAALGLIAWGAFAFHRKQRNKLQRLNDPQKLFDDILAKLDLEPGEKRLIRQMAGGARLKHPAMSLYSPEMLGWTCKLWHKEKGLGGVPTDIIEKIDGLSYKIFGQITTIKAEMVEACPVELERLSVNSMG